MEAALWALGMTVAIFGGFAVLLVTAATALWATPEGPGLLRRRLIFLALVAVEMWALLFVMRLHGAIGR